jgi:glycosyltransferase involved in cell wall biosynthesis
MSDEEPIERPPSVTVFSRSFPPAYLAGGPARSLEGLVATLSKEFRFSIITSAYDASSEAPMAEVVPDRWCRTHEGAMAWYSSRRLGSLFRTLTELYRSAPAAVYFNSLFDLRFTIIPLLLLRLRRPDIPVLLAPRGELSPGALREKRYRKGVFLASFRALGFHRYLEWHASTGLERADIEAVFGCKARTHVAANIRADLIHVGGERTRADYGQEQRETGTLVFLSRIVRKKNLSGLLRSMSLVGTPVDLTIAGPIEDKAYWEECQQAMRELSCEKTVTYVGVVSKDDVVAFLQKFELFVLPTFGENFGHVVLEALAAGTPVIVGSDTPWRNVEELGAGWVCDAGDVAGLAADIERFLGLGEHERVRMRDAARCIATRFIGECQGVEATRKVLFQLVQPRSGAL